MSEYVSNEEIYFKGRTSYEIFVGSLNILAKQYETKGITVGSRHTGYNNQANFISINTIETPSQSADLNGGDEGYLLDKELINKSIGSTIGYKSNSTTATSYWVASRGFWYISAKDWRYMLRSISTDGNSKGNDVYIGSTGKITSVKNALRPIVTLRSGLVASEGTQNDKKIWTIN